MEQFLLILLGYFQHLFSLGVCQVSLLIQFDDWFELYLAKMLCASFADMHVGTVLIVVSIPKQELPNDFCCDIEQYFRHRRYDILHFTRQR
jgi:hypothetical protein